MKERIERRAVKVDKETYSTSNLPYGLKAIYYPQEQYFVLWKKDGDWINMPAKNLEECEHYLFWFVDAINYIHEFI